MWDLRQNTSLVGEMMQLTCRLGHPGAGLRVQASGFQRASAASRPCVSTLPLAALCHSTLQTFSTALTGTVRINLGSSFLPLKVHPRTLGVGGSGLGQDQQASAVHKWSRGVHTMSAAGEHQVAVIGAGGEGTFFVLMASSGSMLLSCIFQNTG